ncbi:MAG: RagB/SusD family nutrient uptake outer membrane protein, partial [Chitinophagaceae bacterium]
TLDAANFYKTERECILAMGNAYSQMQYRGTSLWGLMGTQVLASDEACCPVRTQGTYLNNNGLWVRLNQHTFVATMDPVASSWEFCFNTISACNQVIYQIGVSPAEFVKKPNMIAELKALRAFAYYTAMDLYGNIPVTLDFTDVSLPVQRTRAEVFAIVEKELLDNLALLEEKPSADYYGRCTQPMAYAVLAKMYLNAQKWTGTARWADAIAMCNKIIQLNSYSLEPDYFKNFLIENTSSKENIWVLPYDRKVGWGLQMHQYTLHPSQAGVYNISAPVWNGMVVSPDFYSLYASADKRINSWMTGQQYDASGQPLKTSAGAPLVFTPTVSSFTAAGELEGARCKKWQFPTALQANQTMDNDWVFIRYSDILLMKAEAIMRNNGGTPTQEAVDAVNLIRARAFGDQAHNYTTGTLTLDELLNERGRELAWEGHRRQDLVRFGKWGNAWFGKPVTPATKELYPIPSTALLANSNLHQNTGY